MSEVKVLKEEKIVFCPLLQRACMKENCAWYLQDEKACSILVLAKSLNNIDYILEETDVLKKL
jgi:hypothetical protein